MSVRRTSSVRSLAYCDFYCLSMQDMRRVLRYFPNMQQRLDAVIAERLAQQTAPPGQCSFEKELESHQSRRKLTSEKRGFFDFG